MFHVLHRTLSRFPPRVAYRASLRVVAGCMVLLLIGCGGSGGGSGGDEDARNPQNQLRAVAAQYSDRAGQCKEKREDRGGIARQARPLLADGRCAPGMGPRTANQRYAGWLV